MKPCINPLLFPLIALSLAFTACEKRGPVSSGLPDKDLKPGLPQVPPEKGGAKGAAAAGDAPPAGDLGSRTDYQPSTGQGSQTETKPDAPASGQNPAPSNPNTKPPGQ